MLYNITPITSLAYSIMNNVKPYCRLDKCLKYEKQSFHHPDMFIKELELSTDLLKVVRKSLNDMPIIRFYSYNIFSRRNLNNIDLLIKRNFCTKKSKSLEMNNIIELQNLHNKYNNQPIVQQSINEAFRIGYACSPEKVVKYGNWISNIWRFLFISLGLILLSFFIIVYLRILNLQYNANGCLRSGATLVQMVNVKFEDVQGCDEVKKELQDVVNFLKEPSMFTKIGAKLPKGVLLVGEPGVGKTLLARAVAGEAGIPFLFVSGSHFDEMFVGVGASRVRALFKEAKEHSPCVVFIDELDSLCKERTSSPSHPYANLTINQLLSEMDGFVENEGIVIIGATNRLKDLDKAVLRPGRFDVKVQVHRPDYRGRMSLFDLYLNKVVLDDNIDVATLARSTTGYSGADVKNMVNQAAIICALKGHRAVTMSHLWEAQTKITLGAARTRPMQESENRLTAYHEAGHTIVNYFTPNSSNKVKLVTILPHGESGGHNSLVPNIESSYFTKDQLISMIDGLMGGRAAEELLEGFEQISTGVSSDMEKATKIARQMVKQYTMAAEDVGLQVYDSDNCQCGGASRSPKINEAIDTEVNKILRESSDRAKLILQEHSKEWHALANNLLKYETLEADDIDLVIAGKAPRVATIPETIIDKTKPTIFTNGTQRLLNILAGDEINN